jgi:chlorite dismutase
MLHLLVQVDWTRLSELKSKRRERMATRTAAGLHELFRRGEADESGAVYHVLGHKGDLMIVLLRRTPQELAVAERQLTQLELWEYLKVTYSYLSVVELSLHGAAERYRSQLQKTGVEEGSPAWDEALEELLGKEKVTQHARLYPEVPPDKYLCFYPMNKKRGETKNWFMLTPKERGAMMAGHGKTGRRYSGKVSQVISSSMGFDDYDWGVDLFAEDALQFKKLIYEMRYDEVSAVYADFGPFMLGVRLEPERVLEQAPWPAVESQPLPELVGV